jgi:DNA-binding CsgD family transcriptional regulator
VAEGERVHTVDPRRAAALLSEAVLSAAHGGAFVKADLAGRRAVEIADAADGEIKSVVEAVHGFARVLRGDATGAAPSFAVLEERLESSDGTQVLEMMSPIAICRVWMEEFDRARRILDRVIDSHDRLAMNTLPYALTCRSELDFRAGNWPAAYAGATQSVELARTTGQSAILTYSLVTLARIEAALGDELPCRQHAREAAELGSRVGQVSVAGYGRAAIGFLVLGLGRMEATIEALEPLVGFFSEHGLEEPGTAPWAPDLIEAYVHADRRDAALSVLVGFEEQAHRTGRTWAFAAAARCRGLLAAGEAFESEFEAALRWHERAPMPFERARTLLSFGERLRRARRRTEARARLRQALEVFESLGAAPWSARARSELVASGERARRRTPRETEKLTAQELQVALLIAEGASNREAAAALFLSPKTIEFHLGNAYAKLGVHSRTQLAARLAAGER